MSMDLGISSHASTTSEGRLWLPSRALSACVRAAMARRCDDASLTGDEHCFNHYPASPYCTLSWWLQGQGMWCEAGGAQAATSARRALPRIVFNGPHRGPVSTWCKPPAHGLMLGFRPEAFRLLTGIDPGAWVDRWVDALEVMPANWHPFLTAVADCSDDEQRLAGIEAHLGPLWQAARPQEASTLLRLRDWCEHAALRAAISGTGRSVRQAERRFKHWMGLPQRELRAMGRSEQAFFAALDREAREGRIDWPEVAADAGYADQSHMIRETQRITGFSPQALRHMTRTEPAFWMYRLWGLWG